jgi:phospholipase/carboxylesterase
LNIAIKTHPIRFGSGTAAHTHEATKDRNPMQDLIIQQPQRADGSGAELFLLFHGVGSNAENLRGLGESIAARHPQAWVVSVQSPDHSDLGQGWQWFSVRGITEDNRAGRIADAMPGFTDTVTTWQRTAGADVERTTLVGFSQGAIMSLEATQLPRNIAGRVLAMAGRLAKPPQRAAEGMRIHLLHGQADGVVPAQCSVDACAQLQALQADVSLDLVDGLGHGIDVRMLARLHARLDAPA